MRAVMHAQTYVLNAYRVVILNIAHPLLPACLSVSHIAAIENDLLLGYDTINGNPKR